MIGPFGRAVTGATLLVGLMIALTLALADDLEAGLAQAIRNTARSSCILFLLGFVGPGLGDWVARRRGAWFTAFAVSHVIHAIVIFTLAWITSGHSLADRTLVSFLPGVAIYALILTVAILSTDRWTRAVSRPVPRGLYTGGLYFLWAVFAVGFGHRALEAPAYIVMTGLVAAALIVRLAGNRIRRRPTE